VPLEAAPSGKSLKLPSDTLYIELE
jgi:hypothetical protein